MKPKIPYEPRTHPAGDDKRWTRKLAEAGKLSGRGVKVPYYGPPHYRRINDQPA